MALFQESGADHESRVNEAHDICRMIEGNIDEMSPVERNFVEKMADTDYCSLKQLFWLRDIKEKYL